VIEPSDPFARAPRLKSGIWVAAYVRRCAAAGAYTAISRKGDESAGAVFIEVLGTDGVDLWGPATRDDGGRAFTRLMESATGLDVSERLEREARFDSDLWVVTVEDRERRTFLLEDEHG
jgi:hypothetical protein